MPMSACNVAALEHCCGSTELIGQIVAPADQAAVHQIPREGRRGVSAIKHLS
jgi:hypothetical protein